MSIANIIRKIDKANSRHKEIQAKYRMNNRSASLTNDRFQQEIEDKRIYGFSKNDMLKTFHRNKVLKKVDNRPRTAFVRRLQSDLQQSQKINNKNSIRCKSAQKSTISYKPAKYNFLFKEDIFSQKSQPIYSVQIKNIVTEMEDSKENINLTTNRFKKLTLASEKAHQKAKDQFIHLFQDNLRRFHQKSKANTAKPYVDRVVYQRQTVKTVNNKSQDQVDAQIFLLTKTIEKVKETTKLYEFQQNLSTVNELRSIFVKQSLFDMLIKKKKISTPKLRLESDVICLFPQRFKCLIVDIQHFKCIKLRIVKRQKQFINEATGEIINIKEFIQNASLVAASVFMCFYQDSELIYEQFMFNRNVTIIEKYETQLIIFSFYLKIFLLFDNTSSIKSLNCTSKMLINGGIQFPAQFEQFINIFSDKLTRYSDKSKCLYTASLFQILNKSYKTINVFKKQLKLSEKPIKLAKQGKKLVKKERPVNNWVYFYICLSYYHKISICESDSSSESGSHVFSPSSPYFLAPPASSVLSSTSNLSYSHLSHPCPYAFSLDAEFIYFCQFVIARYVCFRVANELIFFASFFPQFNRCQLMIAH